MRLLHLLLLLLPTAQCITHIVQFQQEVGPKEADMVYPKLSKPIVIGNATFALGYGLEELEMVYLQLSGMIKVIVKDEKIFVAAEESVGIPLEIDHRYDLLEDGSPLNRTIQVQHNAPDHLTRLTTRLPWLSVTDHDYFYDADGSNVVVYVLDSGIATDHPEFGGRAVEGARLVQQIGPLSPHGTHVAGLIGSKSFGVLKNVTLVDVQVVKSNGVGTLSSVLLGIEFAMEDRKKRHLPRTVINISLSSVGTSLSAVAPLNAAVSALVLSGVVVVGALGNSKTRFDWLAPSGSQGIIIASASNTRTDEIAPFGGHGHGDTDYFIFAPGVDVMSLSTNFNETMVMSGSSSSAALVSGASALYLEKGAPPEDIGIVLVAKSTKKLLQTTTSALLERFLATPNRLLYCAPLSLSR